MVDWSVGGLPTSKQFVKRTAFIVLGGLQRHSIGMIDMYGRFEQLSPHSPGKFSRQHFKCVAAGIESYLKTAPFVTVHKLHCICGIIFLELNILEPTSSFSRGIYNC